MIRNSLVQYTAAIVAGLSRLRPHHPAVAHHSEDSTITSRQDGLDKGSIGGDGGSSSYRSVEVRGHLTVNF
ncbi:MAG: hypothetical protein PHF14_15920 [Verrucomicrobiota bacterium]|nr:hypothetical protein [Verrucomicrobiota bacterium]MDD8047952.1 hypothetical protein [Verrucomicrobiota bacterium]MDD8050134.1 hypothetical protein [Verrucomicrobiota bacterium]MDI9383143.1 hypothetical protein [Verrucomicrobiota bacterium]